MLTGDPSKGEGEWGWGSAALAVFGFGFEGGGDVKVFELEGIDRRGGVGEEIAGLLGFGKGDRIADGLLAR